MPKPTIEIAYVGAKESEDAFRDATGIVWFPGSVHAIEQDVASRMLKHPDVFARATDVPQHQTGGQATEQTGEQLQLASAIPAGTGKPTPAQIELARAILAAAEQVPQLTDTGAAVTASTAQANAAAAVVETSAPAVPGAEAVTLAPGGVIGAGATVGTETPPATPAPTAAPQTARAARAPRAPK